MVLNQINQNRKYHCMYRPSCMYVDNIDLKKNTIAVYITELIIDLRRRVC